LNFSQFVGFQNSPNLGKIEKGAETCEFDGKELLFVERSVAISIKVLGWMYSVYVDVCAYDVCAYDVCAYDICAYDVCAYNICAYDVCAYNVCAYD